MLPLSQHQSSNPFSYLDGMKSGDSRLRETVASNLRALMDRRDWSQTDLAKKAKVSQRHISNMLSRKTGASFETLHAVASAFGISGWMLMLEHMPVELLDSQKLPSLVASYCDSGPDGQALVERLAEREAVHNRNQPKVLPLRKSAST